MSASDDLLSRAIAGDRRALARLATHVENDPSILRESIATLEPSLGQAATIGVTGPPGAGKSSLIAQLAAEYRRAGATVAILAVDPSSPLTGGATLGDRIRMQPLVSDPGVFMRSMASRGEGEGLAPALGEMIRLFDLASFDVILIETVGAGQEQVRIADLCQTLVLAQMPGSGDDVQALKAGVLELADVLAVTKSDLPNAEQFARILRTHIDFGDQSDDTWTPEVILCSEANGTGFAELKTAIDRHQQWLRTQTQRPKSGLATIERQLVHALAERIAASVQARASDQVARLAKAVASGEMTIADAVDALEVTRAEQQPCEPPPPGSR